MTSKDGTDLSHQERINREMFRAIEMLGRKIERAQHADEDVMLRLKEIEAAASVDEATGKLYLPVVANAPLPPAVIRAPRWHGVAAVASGVLAATAIALILLQGGAPALTPAQLAALETLMHPAAKEVAAADIDVRKFTAPPVEVASNEALLSAAELAMMNPAAGNDAPDAVPDTEDDDNDDTANADPQDGAAQDDNDDDGIDNGNGGDLTVAPQSPPEEQVSADAADTFSVAPDTSLPTRLAPLEKSAFMGIPAAQHDLAAIYAAGKDVAQDYTRAAFWFRRAADNGVANAHYNLGVMYQQGLGVTKDAAAALRWYETAAKLGHPEAMYNLGIAFIEGVGTPRDTARGMGYFKQAANAGVAQAAYNLGVLYESNFMGEPDNAKAAQWYQVAANEGHGDAKVALQRLNAPLASVEPAAGDDENYGEGDPTTPDEQFPASEHAQFPAQFLPPAPETQTVTEAVSE